MLWGLTEDQRRNVWGGGRHLVSYNALFLVVIVFFPHPVSTAPMPDTSLQDMGHEWFYVAEVRGGYFPGLCSAWWRHTNGVMEVAFPLEMHSLHSQ